MIGLIAALFVVAVVIIVLGIGLTTSTTMMISWADVLCDSNMVL